MLIFSQGHMISQWWSSITVEQGETSSKYPTCHPACLALTRWDFKSVASIVDFLTRSCNFSVHILCGSLWNDENAIQMHYFSSTPSNTKIIDILWYIYVCIYLSIDLKSCIWKKRKPGYSRVKKEKNKLRKRTKTCKFQFSKGCVQPHWSYINFIQGFRYKFFIHLLSLICSITAKKLKEVG